MLWVGLVKSLCDQYLYGLANQILTCITKDVLQLLIDEANSSLFIDNDSGIRHGIHQVLKVMDDARNLGRLAFDFLFLFLTRWLYGSRRLFNAFSHVSFSAQRAQVIVEKTSISLYILVHREAKRVRENSNML